MNALPVGAAGVEARAIWSLAHPLALHFEQQHLYAAYHKAHYLYDRNHFRLEAGGVLRFDRPLNVFGLRKWRKLTDVRELTLTATYKGGSGRVHVLSFNGDGAPRLAAALHLPKSDRMTKVSCHIPASVTGEFLFFQVDAEDEVDLFDVSFTAAAPPRRPVRLGITITTFKREEDVEHQVELLEGLLRGGLSYEVLVVDNGSTLKLTRSYARTTVIPSPNLGGAGGFTRGLMELLDRGDFTHGMFMDDDAFCHPAAILRACALVGFAKERRLALTGAMNYLHAPDRQYELGGRLADYGVASVRQDVDANNLHAALENEKAETPAYGAWWCFLFPLDAVERLPFPFFVRGDDIAFSLQNRFKITSMPGLVAWQPSFAFKIGASVEYLAHRSFLALPLVVGGRRWDKKAVAAGVRRAFNAEVDGLRYPIAESICAALEDVLTGPDFWDNAANTLARVQELGRKEKAFTDVSFLPGWVFRNHDHEQRRSMRLLRRHFGRLNIPAALCFRRPILTNDMFPKVGQAAFRRGMIYFAPDGSRAMSCRRDWRWRRRLERRFDILISEYERRFEDLAADYQGEGRRLQTQAAWRARFGAKSNKLQERALENSAI